MGHMVGGKYSFKISAPKLLRFGIDSVWKILNEMISESINELQRCYRIAPAKLGLVIIWDIELGGQCRIYFILFYH